MNGEELTPELLAVFDREYETARSLMATASNSVDRTRTFGFTLLAALIGFAVSTSVVWLGFLAALAAVLIAYLDGFFTAQATTAATHARKIEQITQLYYKSLLAPLNSRQQRSLGVRVTSFRPGALGRADQFKLKSVWYTRPFPIFRGLYPLLVAAGMAAALYGGLAARDRVVTVRLGQALVAHTSAREQAVAVAGAISESEHRALDRLELALEHSRDVSARYLGERVGGVLHGSPGAMIAVADANQHLAGAAGQAAGILLGVLSRLVATGPAVASLSVAFPRSGLELVPSTIG